MLRCGVGGWHGLKSESSGVVGGGVRDMKDGGVRREGLKEQRTQVRARGENRRVGSKSLFDMG